MKSTVCKILNNVLYDLYKVKYVITATMYNNRHIYNKAVYPVLKVVNRPILFVGSVQVAHFAFGIFNSHLSFSLLLTTRNNIS